MPKKNNEPADEHKKTDASFEEIVLPNTRTKMHFVTSFAIPNGCYEKGYTKNHDHITKMIEDGIKQRIVHSSVVEAMKDIECEITLSGSPKFDVTAILDEEKDPGISLFVNVDITVILDLSDFTRSVTKDTKFTEFDIQMFLTDEVRNCSYKSIKNAFGRIKSYEGVLSISQRVTRLEKIIAHLPGLMCAPDLTGEVSKRNQICAKRLHEIIDNFNAE